MRQYRIQYTEALRPGENAKHFKQAVVEATQPSVALKRLLDGGHEAGYKFATVGKQRLKLGKGERIAIIIERVK